MAGVPRRRRGSRLDFDCDDAASAQVDEQVDLLAAGLGAQVMQPGTGLQEFDLGAKLRGDERVQEAAEEVRVTPDVARGDSRRGQGNGRVDYISFAAFGQAGEPV